MKHAEAVWEKIKAGEESEVQGLLEQWLRDGKMTETEALLSATDMFTAGVDSVRIQLYILLFFQHLHFLIEHHPATRIIYRIST